jgi:hypothetical protein
VELPVLITAAHVTRIILTAAFIPLLLKNRAPALRVVLPALLWALAIAALLAHVDFFTTEDLHLHEFYNYYVGTKYFPELGYAGLHDATVLADYEDDPSSFDPEQGVRSLSTYDLMPRRAVISWAGQIRAPFTPERWTAFKNDIALFREADGVIWRAGEYQIDHGYNGSPLVTAILGGLARQPFLSARTYIRVVRWFDIALVVLAAAVVALRVGPVAGPLFLFLWAVNPFNDHAYIGGAYLRHIHLLALLVALVAYARGRFAASGAAFAVASLLRVFPSLLLAGLLVQNLLSRDRRALLRRHAPLFAAAAATALVLVAATSLIHSPDGGNAWADFAGKISLHGQRISANVVGLSYLFFYSEEHNAAEVRTALNAGRIVDWVTEAGRTFAANRALYMGVMAALAVALLIILRRGRPEDGLFAGLVLVFAGLHLSHYDYSVLALVPFVFPGRRDVLVPLALLFIAVAAARLLPAVASIIDFRFYVSSALMTVYFAATLALRALDRGAPPGAPAWAGPGVSGRTVRGFGAPRSGIC